MERLPWSVSVLFPFPSGLRVTAATLRPVLSSRSRRRKWLSSKQGKSCLPNYNLTDEPNPLGTHWESIGLRQSSATRHRLMNRPVPELFLTYRIQQIYKYGKGR